MKEKSRAINGFPELTGKEFKKKNIEPRLFLYCRVKMIHLISVQKLLKVVFTQFHNMIKVIRKITSQTIKNLKALIITPNNKKKSMKIVNGKYQRK